MEVNAIRSGRAGSVGCAFAFHACPLQFAREKMPISGKMITEKEVLEQLVLVEVFQLPI